jgi:hypothetical protein
MGSRRSEKVTLSFFTLFPAWVRSSVDGLVQGKNLATKEDIAEITNKIESVKAQYNESIERLKGELAARTHYSKVRYEREMDIYREIWPQLHKLSLGVFSLRPAIDNLPPEGQTGEDVKRKRA